MPSFTVDPQRALALGRDVYYGHGKIEILPKVQVHGLEDIAVAFTPGVGHVVQRLIEHPEELGQQTAKDNLVALVTDGTAVLGYGDIGPHAGMPVMEGKAVMFKMLAGIDCMPLCVKARGPDHLVDIIQALEPSFGGFNLEDVQAPGCFAVMSALEPALSVPILHDDQFATATVVAAALINALLVTGRRAQDVRVVVNGVGAAGVATITMLREIGIGDIIAVDRHGILHRQDDPGQPHWREVAAVTNAEGRRGDLAVAMAGADVFIGVSRANLVSPDMVRSMARNPIVFALANPEPEIMPDTALAAGAAVVASGRFDFPNHCNNVLAFPALMRGALDTKSRRITPTMCAAAARTIAASVPENVLGRTNILPSPLDAGLYPDIAEAVARAAVAEGLARVSPAIGATAANTRRLCGLVAERQKNLAQICRGHSASATAPPDHVPHREMRRSPAAALASPVEDDC